MKVIFNTPNQCCISEILKILDSSENVLFQKFLVL